MNDSRTPKIAVVKGGQVPPPFQQQRRSGPTTDEVRALVAQIMSEQFQAQHQAVVAKVMEIMKRWAEGINSELGPVIADIKVTQDAILALLIGKGVFTHEEFMAKGREIANAQVAKVEAAVKAANAADKGPQVEAGQTPQPPPAGVTDADRPA